MREALNRSYFTNAKNAPFCVHSSDTFVVCTVNTFTSFYSAIVIFSILGFMANAKGVEIADVVKSGKSAIFPLIIPKSLTYNPFLLPTPGPGLAFLVYPEVVLQLSPSALWSICFFLMLLALGFDSQFCILESLIVGLVDNWPKYLRPRRLQFTAVMCIFMLILGIPMITQVLCLRVGIPKIPLATFVRKFRPRFSGKTVRKRDFAESAQQGWHPKNPACGMCPKCPPGIFKINDQHVGFCQASCAEVKILSVFFNRKTKILSG